jgi:hypothetical protein
MSGEWRILLMYPGKKTTYTSWNSSTYRISMGSPGTTDFSGATITSTGANSRNNFGDGVGLYSNFFNLKNISKIAFVDGSAGVLNPSLHTNYLIYDLCGTTMNESIRDILFRLDQFLRVEPNFAGNDSKLDSSYSVPSVRNFTSGTNGFSGTLTSSGGSGFRTNESPAQLPTKFCVMGINRDSDNDIQALCAYSGNLNTGKGDSWRGDNPVQTFWSYWGDDFHSNTQSQRIGVSLQTAPGVSTSASWTSDVYILGFSSDASGSVPTTPTGLISSGITDSSYNLSWNSQIDASSYIIQRASDSSFNNILQTYSGITSNSITISDVSSGITYYNRIAAINSFGTSSYSSGITVLTIPKPPNGYISDITYNSFVLNWNNITGAVNYNILVSTNNNFTNIINDISINDISYNIIDLDDYTQYYCKIRSVNATGGSYFSEILTLTTHLYTGITDISDNVDPNTDLTNFLLNNLENVFDTNQFKIYLRDNKNNFNSQIGTVNVSDLSGILSSSYNVTGNENVKFIIFDDNETLEISGNNLNELKAGDILYLSGFDGDSINLLINGNNYNLTLNSTGIIYNSILYELGNNFRLGNDIEFIVKLLGSGGIEGNGIGDPFIKPIFGEKYYLPNDEETYLLFDNLDNLKIYCKNWFAPELNLNNKMSFMRYLIIEYNSLIFGIDLESMQYVKLTNNEDYKKMRLPRFRDEINKYCNFKSIDGIGKISNYHGKKYKMSKLNKKREIIFECDNYKIILKLICDTYYNDLRNNVNLIFSGQINENKIMKFRGAIISEKKIKKIDSSKLFFNKSLYY